MINAMRDLTVGMSKHLKITSNLYLDLIIKYKESILIGPAMVFFYRYY